MKMKFNHQRLRALRDSLHLSQYEFGKKIGLPPQYISMYEKGKGTPTIRTMLKIVAVFNLPSDYFFEQINHQTNNKTRRAANGA